MKKIFKIIVACLFLTNCSTPSDNEVDLRLGCLFLNNCATPSDYGIAQIEDENQVSYRYGGSSTKGVIDGNLEFRAAAHCAKYNKYAYFYEYDANRTAQIGNFRCKKGWAPTHFVKGKVRKVVWSNYDSPKNVTSSISSNTSSSGYSGSSTSLNNYYSNATPKLFYDSSTGGMKECTYVPQDGNCLSFKPYNASNYNKSTLFYDSSSNSMKPCIGIVDLNGKCTAFGIYNANTVPNDQLFYNPKTRQMTTCRFVTISGGCSQYDLVPRTGSTGGSYNIDSASNPYYKKVPRTNQQLMKSGMDMLKGNCTLGLNC